MKAENIIISKKKYKQLKYNLNEWPQRHQLSLRYKMYAKTEIQKYEEKQKLFNRIKRFFKRE